MLDTGNPVQIYSHFVIFEARLEI